jgi:putative inorganic carbon (hco3(-)) transporter
MNLLENIVVNKLNRIAVIGIASLVIMGVMFLLWHFPPEYALSFVLLCFIGILVYREPFIGLLVYLFLNYLRIPEMFPSLDSWHPTRIIVFGLLIIWFLRKALTKDRSFVSGKQLQVLFGLIIVMILSWMNTLWLTGSYTAVIGFLKTVIIFFLVINLVDTRQKLFWFIGMLLVLHMILVFGLIQEFIRFGAQASQLRLGGAIGTADAVGHGGFLGDANDFALAINIMIPFAYFLSFMQQRFKFKLVLIPMFFLFIVGVILTYSRGGFVTLTALFFSFAFLSKRKLAAVSILLIILALIVMLIPADYSTRLKTITTFNTDESTQGRFDAWKAGFKMLIAHPVVGTGVGVFADTYPYYMPKQAVSAQWRVAHNGYIHIAGELGLLGLFLYLSLMYLTFRDNIYIQKILRGSKQEQHLLVSISKGLVCGLIAYMVGSMFLSVCYYDHLYILAAITVAAKQIVVNENIPV